MNKLFIFLIGLLFTSTSVTAQEVPVPESLKTIPNSKCYWGYGVERISTKVDSIHKYIIRVSLQQTDSEGNPKSRIKLKDAKIYCSFDENGISKKIHFKRIGLQWIAKFKIHTNNPVPLKIVANYKNHETEMPLKLNLGTYPGESDNQNEFDN